MEPALQSAARQFIGDQHLRNLERGTWVKLRDADGRHLNGILGRIGAYGTKVDGSEFGIDLMRMQPGSAFPVHMHDGDHLLYFLSGNGIVQMSGQDYPVEQGDSIFIPAEYPHGVRVEPTATEPLVLLAVGHPHKPLEAKDRMKHPPV